MTTQPDPLTGALREAFEEETAESADDAALIARAIAGATKRLEEEKREEPAPVVRLSERTRARRRWLRVAVPLAAAFAASIAMAATLLSSPKDATHRDAPPPPAAPNATAPSGGGGANAAPMPSTPAPESTPTMSVTDLPNAHASASASGPAAKTEATASAADLFRDANQERRAGDVAKAVALYRTLLDRHPESPEAQASHVTLGRLLLDRRGDASGALAEFDAYLKSGANDGALAEEARLGRALSLQKLGRTDDERRAWEELLAKHPQSLHAGRARERLSAIGTP